MMTTAAINTSEDHGQYVGQIYQEYYARLRHYFLAQLSSPSEAEGCVQETLRRFFFFMEDRCWEADAEYIPVYLMRIAGLICSKKLAEKRARRENNLFGKVRTEVLQTIRERREFRQLFPTGKGRDGAPRAQLLSWLRHALAASA